MWLKFVANLFILPNFVHPKPDLALHLLIFWINLPIFMPPNSSLCQTFVAYGTFISVLSILHTVESVYYGYLETSTKCPDYQGVLIFQVILYNNVPFATLTT